LEKQLYCSNTWMVKLLEMLSQLLERISQRKRSWSIILLLLFKSGILLVKRSFSHLVMHSTEEQIVVLLYMILQVQKVLKILANGKMASLKMLDQKILKLSHLSYSEIKLIKNQKEKSILRKHNNGAKRMVTFYTTKHQQKKALQ
jgi:divalent metal cation (Fe/Co/Zn/Cd) transporter